MNKEEEKVIVILHKIAEKLLIENNEYLPGLMIGNSGILLFLSYYYKHINQSEVVFDRIQMLISIIFKQIEEYPIPVSLATGYAGIGWTIHQLIKIGVIDEDALDFVLEIADIINRNLLADIELRDFDHLYGFIGKYFFLSESKLITYANKQKIEDFFCKGEFYCDFENSFIDKKSHELNLGLAHGIGSLGLFFVRNNELCQNGIVAILNKYLDVFSMSLDFENEISIFPNKVCKNDFLKSESRYAWCYGDLGILYFLCRGKEKNSTATLAHAIKVLFEKCNKRNVENSFLNFHGHIGCYDIGFCHGLSGVFYLQLKLSSNNHTCNKFSTNEYWLSKLLENLSVYLEKEDFKKEMDGETKMYDALGVLEGIAGAGLVLLSFLTGDYSWDGCLLLNN